MNWPECLRKVSANQSESLHGAAVMLPHTRKEVHQMTTFSGKGVYGAVALGKVSVFKRRETTVKMLHSFRRFTIRRSKRSARQMRRSLRSI